MKKAIIIISVCVSVIVLSGCKKSLDPLALGSTDGNYSIGMKSLIPLSVGNKWTYAVALYDTTGAERMRYSYTLSVRDTVTADTGLIPLTPPSTNRKSIKRAALLWYRFEGEAGTATCWQVDSLENLCFRKSDDVRFYEQTAFNIRASIGDSAKGRFIGADTSYWASGDRIITGADSVKSTLVSKGVDTLRTTLGSAQYFQYRQFYSASPNYKNFYFKPGFEIFLIEHYEKTPGGTVVRVRRDELTTYYLK